MVFSEGYARRCGPRHHKRLWELPVDEIRQVVFRSALFIRLYPNLSLDPRTPDGLQ
jgi:hypothetical protein